MCSRLDNRSRRRAIGTLVKSSNWDMLEGGQAMVAGKTCEVDRVG